MFRVFLYIAGILNHHLYVKAEYDYQYIGKGSHSNAKANCLCRRMQLVTAKNVEEMQNLTRYIEEKGYRIGPFSRYDWYRAKQNMFHLLDCPTNSMPCAFYETCNGPWFDHVVLPNDEYIWMGLTLGPTTSDPADLMWNDVTPVSWTKWGYSNTPEPNFLDREKCVGIVRHVPTGPLLWHTRLCDNLYHYICQKTKGQSNGADYGMSKTLSVGEYFSICPHLAPGGQLPLREYNVSRVGCARRCLQDSDCDLLYRHESGMCQLYNSKVTNLDRRQTEGWKTYFKM